MRRQLQLETPTMAEEEAGLLEIKKIALEYAFKFVENMGEVHGNGKMEAKFYDPETGNQILFSEQVVINIAMQFEKYLKGEIRNIPSKGYLQAQTEDYGEVPHEIEVDDDHYVGPIEMGGAGFKIEPAGNNIFKPTKEIKKNIFDIPVGEKNDPDKDNLIVPKDVMTGKEYEESLMAKEARLKWNLEREKHRAFNQLIIDREDEQAKDKDSSPNMDAYKAMVAAEMQIRIKDEAARKEHDFKKLKFMAAKDARRREWETKRDQREYKSKTFVEKAIWKLKANTPK